ncbi:MAG: hypothetical protein KME13_23335 [Myxacorys californica WJT36-NPBG1]|jgi:hypothetical protein|nr:hypothetical protein [Myxacorys californica WJT36-NPBG1]
MTLIAAVADLDSAEMLHLAGMFAIVDEVLKVDLDYLKRLGQHPISKLFGDRPEISGVQMGRSQVQSVVASATKQHLQQAEAITLTGVDLEAIRVYCQQRIDAGHGRKVRYIF